MLKSDKKPQTRSILKELAAFALLTVLLLMVAIPLAKKSAKMSEVNGELDVLHEEIEHLSGRNEDLRRLIDHLDSDRYIEEQARKNLNLRKPGENVVVITGENGGNPASDREMPYRIAPHSEEKAPANPQKWFKYFF